MFIKQAMLLGSGNNSIVTTEAFGISGEYDIDDLGGVMSFKLPYIPAGQMNTKTAGVDITRLKKFDTVKLYFGEFSSDKTINARSDSDLRAAGLTLIFDGFVDAVKLAKAKESYNYQIDALTTIGLGNYRTMEFQKKNDMISNMVKTVLDLTGLSKPPVSIVYQTNIPNERIPIDIDGGKTAKEVLMQIREKYAVILHQYPDGVLRLSTAEIFAQNASSVAWDFDFKQGNVFNLDYGDLTTNYNAVLVLGYPPSFGIALDAIGVQNNNGNVNYLAFQMNDLKGGEACEEVARNKLLELERNFSISFQTKLDPRFCVGQCFTMKDYDRYNGTERFIIKKYAFNIDKTDVSATITGYTHSLTLLPQDVVLSPTGIADIDTLQMREKIGDDIGWNGDLSQ